MYEGSTTEDRWSRYRCWNAALVSVICGRESSGLPVFLDLEENVLEKVAIAAGNDDHDPRSGLINAVLPTLNPPSHRAGMFGSHKAQLLRWHIESGDPPPTLALLAVLSLAAEDMHGGDGFAAHDYYNRLMSLLNVTDEHDKELIIKAYRHCSADLWDSLNDWLMFHEGELGIPTAFSLGFAHVGLPISQAILRATDRGKLREFFEDFGFAQRSHLAPRVMGPLLGEWIGRTPSPASNAMQKLWQLPGAQVRIIEGACALLESWDGPRPSYFGASSDGTGRRSAPIQLVALLRTFPSAALEFNFTGPLSSPDENSLELLDANGAVSQMLAIEAVSASRWRLAEPDRIELLSILDGRLRLRDRSDLVMERRPRRVVAMSLDTLLQVFSQVERLPLGEATLILCKKELADSIETALSIIARPGFTKAPSELKGIPPGWALFVDVQLLAPLPAVRPDGSQWEFADDLNVLQPLSTSQLVIEAGLRLPGHLPRWSSLAPPEVRVVIENATSVAVRVTQTKALARNVEPISTTADGSAAIVRLAELNLPDGDYEIIASNAATDQTIDQLRLRLRSADVSNPGPPRLPPLSRSLFETASVLGASISVDDDGAAPTLQGAVIANAPPLSEPLVESTSTLPSWWSARATANMHAVRADRVILPPVALEDCFRTGRHFIVLPTYTGRTSAASVEGYCRQCGIVKRYPARYRAGSASPQEKKKYVPPAFDPARLVPVSDRSIPPDVALDALSHDRAGNARAMEQLALQIEPSQLFVDGFLRGLESLGHIEVRRDERTLLPTSWKIAPSALVQIKSNAFVLAGFRSRRLLAALETAATALGIAVDRRSQQNAPDRVRIRDCGLDVVESIVRRVFDETGTAPSIVIDAATSIARFLPPLSLIREVLPTTAMVGYRSANRWDEELASWVAVGDASAPGAYQLHGSVSVYCLRDTEDVQNGTMRRGDARIVKHLASTAAGFPLLGYDKDTETLYAPLGADLPGLYARVAVLASGLLPIDDLEQRLVAYPSVPALLAGQLIALMRS